jgi:hypothetical protein
LLILTKSGDIEERMPKYGYFDEKDEFFEKNDIYKE